MVPGPAGVAAERNGERPATLAGPHDHPGGVPFGRYPTIVRVSDPPLISASQLIDVLSHGADSVAPPVLLDVRWTLAGSDRAGYLEGHIPGARFVDLDRELAGARFRGETEPIDPVAGHIPGSVNLPIAQVLAADGTFRDPGEIRAAFAAVGLGVDATPGTAAASCGSGVTACQLILAGRVAGIDLALFPGSYSQWCAAGHPVAVGNA